MPKVQVRMFATVREAAGVSECSAEAEDVPGLIAELKARFGGRLANLLAQLESDPDRLVVLVNGKNIGALGRGSVRLREGDEVAIFPPVSGG